MTARLLVLSVFFLSASAYLANNSRTEPVPIRESLAGLPLQIGKWRGQEMAALDTRVVSVLGVDDYLDRFYTSGSTQVSVYIGFYQSQRQGSAIHSPLNCLPGAGWNPVDRTYATILVGSALGSVPDRNIVVNRIMIQKGLSRQIVLYWYQSHGRVIASEYWGKLYMVADAMRMNRTDAALVRVIAPVLAGDAKNEEAAEASAVDFAQSIFPLLSRHLPE